MLAYNRGRPFAAGLFLVATGCGHVERSPDANLSSASATSGSAGTGGSGGAVDVPGVETFHVVDYDRMPRAGVSVVVSDQDGEITTTSTTDASGNVSVDVPEGGMTTFVIEGPDCTPQEYQSCHKWRITSYLGLDGVDSTIELGEPRVEGRENDPMSVTVDGPALPPGAQSFELQSSCRNSPRGFSSFPHTIPKYRGCPGATKFDVVVVAVDSLGDLVAAGALLDQPFSPNGAAVLDVAFTLPIVETLVTVDPVPPGAATAMIALVSNRGTMTVSQYRQYDAPAGSLSVTLKAAGGLDRYLGFTMIAVGERRLDRSTGWQPQTFDAPIVLGAQTPANVLEAFWDTTDDGRPRVSWTLDGGGAVGDRLEVGAEGWQSRWDARFPVALSGSVAFPKLPAQLDDFENQVPATKDPPGVSHVDWASERDFVETLDGVPLSSGRVSSSY